MIADNIRQNREMIIGVHMLHELKYHRLEALAFFIRDIHSLWTKDAMSKYGVMPILHKEAFTTALACYLVDPKAELTTGRFTKEDMERVIEEALRRF